MATLSRQVAASADDCYHKESGDFRLTHTETVVREQHAISRNGMRFTGVTIPQGATINSARLDVICRADQSTTVVRSNLRGEAVDNAAQFSTEANYIGRARTTALVVWDNIVAWVVESTYASVDISAIIQEVVDRELWVSGQSLVIFWEEDGSDNGAWRFGYSYDGDSAKGVTLVVGFTPPAAGGYAVIF